MGAAAARAGQVRRKRHLGGAKRSLGDALIGSLAAALVGHLQCVSPVSQPA